MLRRHKIISTIPALLIMGMIFCFSHQEAAESSRLSSGIINHIFSFIERIFAIKLASDRRAYWLEILEIILRKTAHMTEYGILAIAVSYSFYVYNKRGSMLVGLSEVVTVFYAITDEIHQLFIQGRSGKFTDVLIDGVGALIGCWLFYILYRKVEKRKIQQGNKINQKIVSNKLL